MTTIPSIGSRSSNKKVEIPPNPVRLIEGIRKIGYSQHEAVADIVDNSIDAKAKNILIRFQISKDGHVHLIIADDGCGMSQNELKEAMRFGSKESSAEERLGKFGLGLKLACLSQSDSFIVASVKSGKSVAKRCSTKRITGQQYDYEVLPKRDVHAIIGMPLQSLSIHDHGTVVICQNISNISGNSDETPKKVDNLINPLRHYLGLYFHRFLERPPAKKVNIFIDSQDEQQNELGNVRAVTSLNPFNYPKSGHKDFPISFHIKDVENRKIKFTAHIWPGKSNLPEYKLPGGPVARQGFYFYRNNRLIQAGGWCNLFNADPHDSLARVEVEIPEELDGWLNLEVKKTSIKLPPELKRSIQDAEVNKSYTFKEYRKIANKTYRLADKKKIQKASRVLGAGLPKSFLQKANTRIRNSPKGASKIDFEWKKLNDESFFSVDRDKNQIILNSIYRQSLLGNNRASKTDAPVIKLLLFLLLEEKFAGERISASLKKKLDEYNALLVLAAKIQSKKDD